MRRLLGCVGFVGVLVAVAVGPARAQFSLPDEIVTDCSSTVVNIMTTDAGGTVGFDVDVVFASEVVAVQDVSLAGTLTADCEYAYNDTNPDIVNISIACTSPKSGSGAVARITFVPVSQGSTDLSFTKCETDEEPCGSTTDGSLTISGCPSIDLSNSGQGTYGLSPGRVCLAGALASNGAAVAAVSTELTFDSSKFAIENCSINPTVSAVGKSLSRSMLGAGHELISVSGGASSIPSGNLFVCTLTVVSGVVDGSYVVDNIAAASDASSVALPAVGSDGTLHITSCAADCNGDGEVKINEVSRASGLFLGSPLCNATNVLLSCPNADMIVLDNEVKINEVSRASCLFLSGICSKTCP